MSQSTFIQHKMAVSHLNPSVWETVNKKYIRKAIAEFSHEKLFKPTLIEEGAFSSYVIYTSDKKTQYSFKAKKLKLEHWWILEDSIIKVENGKIANLSLICFINEFQDQLNIPNEMLPTYLEEIINTLYAISYKYFSIKLSADELANASFQSIERNMIEGHPCFVANSGRIGFSFDNFYDYSPEASSGFQLLWLAGHRSLASFTTIDALSYEEVLKKEIGEGQFEIFKNILKVQNINPEDYYIFPMHPFQWENKLSMLFAGDIATKKLILLGEGNDKYQPQQSIRTLFNQSNTEKYYVKTALSIQNMGFLRGLSPYYMASTPSITDWINTKLGEDKYLKQLGFQMLNEVATLGYRNKNFESLGRTNAYNKMLAVLWRESPEQFLTKNQKAATMASLLHITPQGESLLKAYIDNSPLNAEQWLLKYLSAYLKPLLHCLFAHEIAFMPHGENLILKLEKNVPVGVFMKDITEEVVLFEEEKKLPEAVKRLVVKTTDEIKALSILTDVFDCFFRFMGQIVEEYKIMSEDTFWRLVAQSITEYQEEHPELNEKFEKSNLFSEDFFLSCLNRLQLQNNKQMVDLTDPVNSLQFRGRIKNPIHQFQPSFSNE